MENYEADISGIDKAELLKALYDNASPLGLGFLQATKDEMSIEQAKELLSETTYFDYVFGRPLKVNLKGDTIRTDLYDRDQGYGKANAIIEGLRSKISK